MAGTAEQGAMMSNDIVDIRWRDRDSAGTRSPLSDMARSYIDLGWSVVPVPFRTKFPTIKAWQNLEITKIDIPKYFDGRPQNIGVLLGEKSGGLVDIDLDSPEAVKLAPYFLPKTEAIFGRHSKPASHWLYNCPYNSISQIQ